MTHDTQRTRRQFLQYSAIAAGALMVPGCSTVPKRRSIAPGEPLNLGVIGVGGRGRANLSGVKDQNIVALCDVDSRFLESASEQFPGAKTYADFRDLIRAGGLDGVVISTPDHHHAFISIWAMNSRVASSARKASSARSKWWFLTAPVVAAKANR